MDSNYWTKCLPLPPEPDSMAALTAPGGPAPSTLRRSSSSQRILHMDIERESPGSGGHGIHQPRHSGVLKACFSSSFILVVAILVGFCISLISFKLTGWSPGREHAEKRLEYHHSFIKKASHSAVAEFLKELTKLPHVAGSPEDISTADYVQAIFESYGLKTRTTDYNVLLSFPVKRSLSLVYKNGSEFELPLRESPTDRELDDTGTNVIPPFHAYSPSGNVVANAVYVNYGREEDYKKLKELGLNVTGAIVIARYGQIFRGDIVSIAANAGAVAVLLYSDPKDFASGGESGYYPDAQWLPPTGVQRGTVFQGIGDPLTPGWPATPQGERLSDKEVAETFPAIPSLPISASDALCILRELEGPIAPHEWHGSLSIPSYRLGRGPVNLRFNYEASQRLVTVRNVFAVIEGSKEPDRYVLLGNHRDAWTFGAVDPGSGTAALLEIARRFGKLIRHGWQPRRTIMLCSWDAEEYGMIGSTEWVEQNEDLLAVRAVAYLNVDCAVAGPGFFAAGTPQIDLLLKEVTKQVKDPDSHDMSVHDTWITSSEDSRLVSRLGGGGSDFAAFLHHVGIPCADIYFGKDYPVYHSLYDNYHWIEMFGDPGFKRTTAASSIWGLMGLRLADDIVLPFEYAAYTNELEVYAKAVEEKLAHLKPSFNVTVSPLWSSLKLFKNAVSLTTQEKEIFLSITEDVEKSIQLATRARMLNDRLIMVERSFLDSDGLEGKPWYKHLIYGPTKDNEYGSSCFPGIHAAISSAIESQDWSAVQHEIWRVARVIDRAALVLKGEFT